MPVTHDPTPAGALPATTAGRHASDVPDLRTDRLLLRRWRESDLEPFAALNADPEVMEHFPAPLTREQSDAMVERIERSFEERGFGLWATEVVGTGELIGFVGLAAPSFHSDWMVGRPEPVVEVGWRLRRTAWGQGFATEAARAAVGFGFEVLGLQEIVSFTVVENVRSQAVMRRLGMRFLARYDHPISGGPSLPSVAFHLPGAI